MTGLDLSVAAELSRSFEPCLNFDGILDEGWCLEGQINTKRHRSQQFVTLSVTLLRRAYGNIIPRKPQSTCDHHSILLCLVKSEE